MTSTHLHSEIGNAKAHKKLPKIQLTIFWTILQEDKTLSGYNNIEVPKSMQSLELTASKNDSLQAN